MVETVMLVDDARIVAWVCFVLGAIMLAVGVVLGVVLSLRRTGSTKAEVEKVQQQITDTEDKLAMASTEIENMKRSGGLEAGGVADTSAVESATADAASSAKAAKSAVEQIQGAIASLPENVRFAGLLLLTGAALMSVATVQFGGTSLF